MKYFNTITKTLAVEGMHPIDPPGVLPIADNNVFFDPMPAGHRFTYDGAGLPDGTEPVPPPVYTVAEQARLDLHAAGVNVRSVMAAWYLDDRGEDAQLDLINAAFDAVVISSGLTLTQVVRLV